MARWTGQGQEGLTLRVVADAEGILHSPHLHQGRHMGRQACRQAEVTGAFERCEVDSCEQAPQQAGATAQQQLLAGSQCWAGTRRLAGQQMQLGGGSRAGTLSAFRGSHHPSAAAAAALLLGLAATATAGAFWAAALKKIEGHRQWRQRQLGRGVKGTYQCMSKTCMPCKNMRRRLGRGKAGQAPVLPPGEPPTMPPAPSTAPPSGRLNRTEPASRPAAGRQAGMCRRRGQSLPAKQQSTQPASQPACAAWLAEPYTWVLHPLPAKP
jgi:hypothetical protein